MFKLYEKTMNKFENQKRAKLGDIQFLTKYIKKYSRHIKIYKRLLIPITFCSLIVGPVYISLYFRSEDILALISGISVTIAGFLWIIVYFTYRYHHFHYIQSKIDAWREELRRINESNYNEI